MLSVRNKTKQRIPRWPWQEIASAILGADYELSLTFAGHALLHRLNRQYRGQDKPTNVLAFPLDQRAGDIFINLILARQEAPAFNHSASQQILFLFIHGLLHLKGLDHGSTMERKERDWFSRFSRR